MVQGDIIVGLDLGTTKICAVIAEATARGGFSVVGVGHSPSDGLRRGVVVDVEQTVASVRKALGDAQRMAGLDVEWVYTGIAGEHISSLNSRGVIGVGGPGNEIGTQDRERVIEAARAVAIPFDREVLHVLPQEFVVDDQRGIRDPVGMSGVRLETSVHIVTGAVTSAQNICKSIERAGVRVRDLMLEPLASGRAVLEADERDMGVCLVDIGGGTTDMAIYLQGGVCHTAVIGLGGQNVTNDIALCLRTSMPHAEQMKRDYGAARRDLVSGDETVVVPGVAGRPAQTVARGELAAIIEARMEEMFGAVKGQLQASEYARFLGAGVVVTGGGALLEGTVELAEEVLEMPVRLGVPRGFKGLGESVASPVYSTVLGLVLLGGDAQDDAPVGRRRRRVLRDGGYESIFRRMKEWFKNWL